MSNNCMAVSHGSPANSGITTHAKAVEWARNYLSTNAKIERVYILSLDAIAERAHPPIMVTPYKEPEPDGNKADPLAT